MVDITEELDSIRTVLSERGIEFALCGGIAMAIYGFVRATVDLDLLVKAEDVKAVERAAASIHRAIIDEPAGDRMVLNLLVVTDEAREVWNGRHDLVWRDKPLTVVSRDGLITLKRLRGSLQDLADIDRMPKDVDFSSTAIELRLKRLGQIRNLCVSLGKAGAEARKNGQLPPVTPSTSKASSDR